MIVQTVFVYPNKVGYQAHATIEVEGLGEVKIAAALSAELCARICEEAEAALRVKLGQVVHVE